MAEAARPVPDHEPAAHAPAAPVDDAARGGSAPVTRPGDERVGRYADGDLGWTLAMELITATFVWGGIGWLVDRWLGTGPVLMVLGFVLGNALGIYLIWLRSQARFEHDHAELLGRRSPRSTPRRSDDHG